MELARPRAHTEARPPRLKICAECVRWRNPLSMERSRVQPAPISSNAELRYPVCFTLTPQGHCMSTRIEQLVERQVMLWRMRLAIVSRRSRAEASPRADIDSAPPESQAPPSQQPPPKSGVRYRAPTLAGSGKSTAGG